MHSVRQGSRFYACFKATSLTEEDGGLLAKITNHVEEIKFHDRVGVLLFLIILATWLRRKWLEKEEQSGWKVQELKIKEVPHWWLQICYKKCKSRLLVRVQVFANGKRKLNAVIVEVGVFRCIQCKTFKSSCCLLFLHLIQSNIFIFEYHIYSIKHYNQCLSLGGLIKII